MEERVVLALHARSLDRTWRMSSPELNRFIIVDPAFFIGLVGGRITFDVPRIVYH